MNREFFNKSPTEAKKQLLTLGITLALVVSVLTYFVELNPFLYFLAILSIIAILGVIAYPWVGRSIFLVFAILSFVIGSLVSRVVVFLIYVFGVLVFGLLLKGVGMNHMKKSFKEAKAMTTNFEDAPASDRESFTRQS